MDKEMELLLSEKEIKINSKVVVVKRIALLDTIRIASHISDVVSRVMNSPLFDKSIAKILYKGSETETETEDEINGIRITGILEIIGMIGDDGVDIIKEIVVKSTNISDTDLEEVGLDDGIDLIFAIYEVNKGFFEKFMSKLQSKTKKKITSPKKEKLK